MFCFSLSVRLLWHTMHEYHKNTVWGERILEIGRGRQLDG